LNMKLVKKKQTLSNTFMHLSVLVVSGVDILNDADQNGSLASFVKIYQLLRVKRRPAIVVVTKIDMVTGFPARDVKKWAAVLGADPADVYLMANYTSDLEDEKVIDLMAANLLAGMLIRAERALQYVPLAAHRLLWGKLKQNPMPTLIAVLSVLVVVLACLVMFLLWKRL